jgi:hypothetical protein
VFNVCMCSSLAKKMVLCVCFLALWKKALCVFSINLLPTVTSSGMRLHVSRAEHVTVSLHV